jgi:hypothetical protein
MELYKVIVDASTGEITHVELTQDEIDAKAEFLANIEAEEIARKEKEAADAAAKQSARGKLAALGLTEEEISAILGA